MEFFSIFDEELSMKHDWNSGTLGNYIPNPVTYMIGFDFSDHNPMDDLRLSGMP